MHRVLQRVQLGSLRAVAQPVLRPGWQPVALKSRLRKVQNRQADDAAEVAKVDELGPLLPEMGKHGMEHADGPKNPDNGFDPTEALQQLIDDQYVDDHLFLGRGWLIPTPSRTPFLDEILLAGHAPPPPAKIPPPEPTEWERNVGPDGRAHGVGRRKRSIARVWIREGTGEVKVNRQLLVHYFTVRQQRFMALEPFFVTDTAGKFDVSISVNGGGINGQAEAARLGVARALQNFMPELRRALRKGEFLTRDARRVERKKPGQKKARKKTQWVKR